MEGYRGFQTILSDRSRWDLSTKTKFIEIRPCIQILLHFLNLQVWQGTQIRGTKGPSRILFWNVFTTSMPRPTNYIKKLCLKPFWNYEGGNTTIPVSGDFENLKFPFFGKHNVTSRTFTMITSIKNNIKPSPIALKTQPHSP